jgi:hypothetical protein
VARFALKVDPMATDPYRWGHSLSNLAEIWLPLLDAVAPRSVIELGAYAGDVTQLLLDWAADSGARVWSVDPEPQEALVRMSVEHPTLELVRTTSHEALARVPAAEAVIVDGDHNYYTVSEELRLIAERAEGRLPLVICHDVCWPHARRDSYYAPERIPDERRQPTVQGGFVFPGDPGLHSGGLPYRWPAVMEGGPRNGVRTAIQDFVAAREDIRLTIVPAFFGMAVIWPREATWSETVEQLLKPWDDNPVLARMEANRALHLASWQLELTRAGWCQDQSARKDAFLAKLLQSRTFSVAIWLSRVRQRGEPAFSKDEVRRLLSP